MSKLCANRLRPQQFEHPLLVAAHPLLRIVGRRNRRASRATRAATGWLPTRAAVPAPTPESSARSDCRRPGTGRILGTDLANLSKVLDDRELGPYQPSWTMPPLAPGTVYCWRVVSRTMAGLWRSSMTCSFKTTGAGGSNPMGGCLAGPTPPPDPVPVPGPQDSKVTTTPVEAPLVVRPAVLRVDRLAARLQCRQMGDTSGYSSRAHTVV